MFPMPRGNRAGAVIRKCSRPRSLSVFQWPPHGAMVGDQSPSLSDTRTAMVRRGQPTYSKINVPKFARSLKPPDLSGAQTMSSELKVLPGGR